MPQSKHEALDLLSLIATGSLLEEYRKRNVSDTMSHEERQRLEQQKNMWSLSYLFANRCHFL